ncbi:MAG: rRNA maturation RNase YbeY [Acidobacteriota bacterium]
MRPDHALDLVVHNPNRYPEISVAELRRWLSRLVGEVEPAAASLGVRFSGDRLMRQANRRFRGRDKTTDVLSFPGEETPEGRHLGDILISLPTARRQATAHGHSIARELRVLLIHGLLHCQGHDHEADDGTMERLEAALRRRWLEAAP